MAESKETSTLNYHKTESRNLVRFRRWTTALAITSGVLLVAMGILITGVVFLVADQSRLAKENSDLRDQIATQNSVDKPVANSTDDSTDTSLIDGLDTTKLLTQNDVGQGQIPDHYLGNPNSRTIVIEYEDFACSHCQALATTAQQIHNDYKDKVLFIHRDFNLNFADSTAMFTAAEAAFLAGSEEAYWQMLSKLYAGPTGDSALIENYAAEIGLDQEKFREAVANAATNGIDAKIARDKQAGMAANIQGTPTWLLNGVEISLTDANIREKLDAAPK